LLQHGNDHVHRFLQNMLKLSRESLTGLVGVMTSTQSTTNCWMNWRSKWRASYNWPTSVLWYLLVEWRSWFYIA